MQVVKYLGMNPISGVRVSLISEQTQAAYSGMLPGCLAGQYESAQMHIRLLPLCAQSGVRFIQAQVSGLDLINNRVLFEDRPPLAFDVLSLNCGAQPLATPRQGVAVKPISKFLPAWQQVLRQIQQGGQTAISIVGAGAGGVELALASRAALPRDVQIKLYGSQLLKDHSTSARKRVNKILAKKRIEYVKQRYTSDAHGQPDDQVFWVTDVQAPAWVADSGLSVDAHGFVRVDKQLRSVSHSHVFAAGDIAHLLHQERPKAGVYAVRAGVVLARNLSRVAQGLGLSGPKHRFKAQTTHLNLINCADGTAVASYGPLASHSRFWWWLKDRIDRAFIAKFNDLPEMPDPQFKVSEGLQDELPDETMRCGGCGAKIAAEPLRRVLARLPKQEAAYVSLGIGDDAAQISNQSSHTLLSVDGFRSMIDDPYMFGRIAAHHSLNDIYAMAAQPTAALAFVTVPLMAPRMIEEELFQVLSGAVSVLNTASVPLVGGHSAEGAELGVALTVTGNGSGRALTKGSAQQGDVLILTKALGTGVLLAAAMRGEDDVNGFTAAIQSMDQSNEGALSILLQHGVRALTDVTGFGLLGHVSEMLRSSGLGVSLHLSAVALLPDVVNASTRGVRSSLYKSNALAIADYQINTNTQRNAALDVLVDPQTSGGLLAAVPPDCAEQCVMALHRAGYPAAAAIGELCAPDRQEIIA